MNRTKQQRDSNIELLRIVLMLLIILMHLIVHGSDLKNLIGDAYITTPKDGLFTFLYSFICVSVVSFIFISGYYGIRFKVKTLLSIVIQAIFYSVSIFIFFKIFVFKENILSYDFFKCFFPLSFNSWWFLSAYVGLYILSPLLNKACQYLTKIQLAGVILFMVYLQASFFPVGYNFYSSDGLSLFSFVVIYLIARFCYIYEIKIPKPFLIYTLISIFTFLGINLFMKIGWQSWGWRITTLNIPLVIIGGVCLFYTFKNIKIQSPIINKISPLLLGVYLLHDSKEVGIYFLYPLMRDINKSIGSPVEIMIILLLFTITIFIAGTCIEKIRQIICAPIVDYIYNVINKFLPKILIKLNLVEEAQLNK
ncbi:MAG: acyltransferase family protein [Dysgonomonas sp.]|nr:acyltransferase family protein [Dysgonomonas sp.]